MRLSSWLAPLLLIPALAMADGTVYRWTDANGQTHFSQTPPGPGKKYDMIQGKRASSTTPESGDGAPSAPSAEEARSKEQDFIRNAEAERKAKTDAKSKEKADREAARAKCAQARERVTFLEERTARRLVTKADDGNYARMDEDEFLKRLDEARRGVSTSCGAP